MNPTIYVTLVADKGWAGVHLTLSQFARARGSLEGCDFYHFELVGSLC